MKNLLVLILIAFLVGCTKADKTGSLYNKDEIIFVVEMDSNEGKSIEDITEF